MKGAETKMLRMEGRTPGVSSVEAVVAHSTGKNPPVLPSLQEGPGEA